MQPGEPLLLLCEGFPPVPGIGGRRWAKFAKELARRGHPVHVIRGAVRPQQAGSLWAADGAAPGIIHHVLPINYPSVLTKRPLDTLAEKVQYRLWRTILPLLVKGNYHDASVFHRRAIGHMATRLIQDHGIRNVIATGAPFRLMAYAIELKQSMPRLNVMVDFRDEWTWGGHYGLSSLAPARLQTEKAMEARVVQQADKVISPHKTVLDHLRGTYAIPSERTVWIPHTVDPEDFRNNSAPAPGGPFRIIYAGNFYGVHEADQYFNALLDTFSRLRAETPEAFANCRLDLYITGQGGSAYAQQVSDRGLGDQIRFHAPLPPQEILEQIAASSLVINFFPKDKKDVLGTKFHEIFYLRRPILHVGEPGLVSRTLIERKLGDSIRVEELVTELPKIIRGERKIEIDRAADHSAYLLGPVTDRLLNEVLV